MVHRLGTMVALTRVVVSGGGESGQREVWKGSSSKT